MRHASGAGCPCSCRAMKRAADVSAAATWAGALAVDFSGVAAVQIELRNVGRVKADAAGNRAAVQNQRERHMHIGEVEAFDDPRAEDADSSRINQRDCRGIDTEPSDKPGANLALVVPLI